MSDHLAVNQAFKIKGRLFAMPMMQILNINEDLFKAHLETTIKKAPLLFDGSPVVLDLSVLDDASIRLSEFINILKQNNINPVAVLGVNQMLEVHARSLGLSIISSSQDNKNIEKTSESKIMHAPENIIIANPVRSGQQIYANNGDLTVIAQVGAGAEILAKGSIHVYGPLRGRALAGVSGDKTSRIFCNSLQAELVSIAGLYLTSEQIVTQDKPCQIFLVDDRLVIEAL